MTRDLHRTVARATASQMSRMFAQRPVADALQRLSEAVRRQPRIVASVAPRALIVGGYVRDLLLEQPSKDMDIEVYGVPHGQLASLLREEFPKVVATGVSFGVLKVSLGDGVEIDVSIPRRESRNGTGQRGSLIDGDPTMDVWEAARRRDFTINSLALDPLNAEIFDGFGGLQDIESRLMRVTDTERFQDDSLRVMRAVQFVARFDLQIESASLALMRRMVARGDLDSLPPERIAEEWKKLLMRSQRPSQGIELMYELGITERHWPELHGLRSVAQDPQWHPEGDVWIHTMMVLDAAAAIARRDADQLTSDERMATMFGALVHDFGKPATTQLDGERVRSRGHEAAGEAPARAFLSRLALPNSIVESAVHIAMQHLKPGMLHRQLVAGQLTQKGYASAVRKLARRVAPTPLRVLLAASEADFRGRTLPGVSTATYAAGELLQSVAVAERLDVAPRDTLVKGRDVLNVAQQLGLTLVPGPWVGEIIVHVEAARDRGEVETHGEAISFARMILVTGTRA